MITKELLKLLLSYDSESGVFTRLVATSQAVKVGEVAGTISSNGYSRIFIHGRSYLSHRLAWLYVFGMWPDKIDHINGIRTDNSIDNLRSVTTLENHKNRKKSKSNTSGVSGVCWSKHDKYWVASISKEGGRKFLLQSKYKWDAICARKSAERNFGYHENSGRD